MVGHKLQCRHVYYLQNTEKLSYISDKSDGELISDLNYFQGAGEDIDCERVAMGDSVSRQPGMKVPRRTIYFASGETMEEYSTDEEDEEDQSAKKHTATVDLVR